MAAELGGAAASERLDAWSMVETDRTGKVLTHLHDEICATLARELEADELVASAQALEMDDLVDIIQRLPPELRRPCCRASVAHSAPRSSRCCRCQPIPPVA